jgi:RNase P subunit RPR2
MINTGTCPKCDKVLVNVKAEDMRVNVGFTPAWQGLSFLCPHCNTVLGIGINPLLVRDEIVREIRGLLDR